MKYLPGIILGILIGRNWDRLRPRRRIGKAAPAIVQGRQMHKARVAIDGKALAKAVFEANCGTPEDTQGKS